jgi:hypothetical protein
MGNTGYILGIMFKYIYLALLTVSFFLALANRPNFVKGCYTIICLGWVTVALSVSMFYPKYLYRMAC